MPKYKVIWIESHNPYNWGDTYEEGVKEIFDSLPPNIKQINLGNNDEWLDLECWDSFEANSDEEAYQYVLDNYEIPNDVFSIHNEQGDRIATEEGLDNDAYCPYCQNKYNSNDGHSCWEKRSGLVEPKGE